MVEHDGAAQVTDISAGYVFEDVLGVRSRPGQARGLLGTGHRTRRWY